MIVWCPRGEMDITTAFEAVIVGSNPAEGEIFLSTIGLPSYTYVMYD